MKSSGWQKNWLNSSLAPNSGMIRTPYIGRKGRNSFISPLYGKTQPILAITTQRHSDVEVLCCYSMFDKIKKTLPTVQRIVFFIILFLFLTIIFTTYGLYQKTARELAGTRRKMQALELKITPPAQAPTQEPVVQATAQFIGLSTTSADGLRALFPLSAASIKESRELSPGVIAAILIISNNEESVWILNLNRKQFTQILRNIDVSYGNSIRLKEWVDGSGVQVQLFTSPGEAVGNVRNLYIDESGRVIAESFAGDFDKPGNELEIKFGDRKYIARLIQRGEECHDENPARALYLESKWSGQATFPPTTTLLGLRLNGKVHPFPHPVVAECEFGYGESVGNPKISEPSFDGNRMVFHVPGYNVSIHVDGRITYAVKTSYYEIPCELGSDIILRLLREDQFGTHQIDPNIADEPLLKEYIGDHCFSIATIKDQKAHFIITKVNNVSGVPYDAAEVDYNEKTRKFENLQKKQR